MKLLATFSALLLTAASAAAAESLTLENGLHVVLDRRPVAPAVSVEAFVRAGRVEEPPGLAGEAHFTEHMVFRATARRPEGGADRAVWRVGGRLRAYTHEDFTRYAVHLPSDHLDLALDLLAGILREARFFPEEVEEERRVVLDEIRKRSADPEAFAWEELTGLAFLPHPYGARISGTLASVSAITRDDLAAFYHRYYRPDRTVLVLVGDFEREDALARIRGELSGWRAEGPAPAADAPPLPNSPGHYQEMTLRRRGATPIVMLAAPLPAYLDPDYIPGRFVREILAGWATEQVVVRDRAALAADVYFSPTLGRNLLKVRLTLARPEDAARARDSLLGLLRDMAGPAFPWSGLQEIASWFHAREDLLAEDFEGLASVHGRAALAGYYSPEGRPAHLVAPDRYTGVTAEDLTRVARTCFAPERIRVLHLLPPGTPAPPAAVPSRSGETEPPPRGAAPLRRVPAGPSATPAGARGTPHARDADASRLVLPGGAVLLHLERESSPLVSGAIVLPAGSRYDPPGLEGLAALTLRAVSLATEGFEADALRWRLFALGNDYDLTADRDTAVASFTVPRERTAEALSLLADMLTHPALGPEVLEEARGRLLRQALRSRDQVGRFAGAAFRRAVFHGTPYAHEEHGTPESLARIRLEDVRAFHRRRYRFDHAVVSLVGGIAPRRARALALALPAGSEADPDPAPDFPVPKPAAGELRLAHPSGRAYVILGGPAPPAGGPGRAEAALLRLVLGWRAFDEFTEKRSTAYEAGAFLDSFPLGSAFGLYVGTGADRLAESRDLLRSLLDEAARGEIPGALLEDSRNAWLGGADLANVRAAEVARRLAWREAVGIGYASFDRLREQVRTMTRERLAAFVAERLPPEKRVTVVVGPDD